MALRQRPKKQGMYDPAFEHDSCGVGFVAHIKGQQSHKIIDDAREILVRMTHRGAVGAEKNTGDGAGILTTLPQLFLEKIAKVELGITLPKRGEVAAGIIFMPQEAVLRAACQAEFEKIVKSEGQRFLGWRKVPVDNSMIGPTALASEPHMMQAFVAANVLVYDAFESNLFVIL